VGIRKRRERDNRGFGDIFDGFLTGIEDKERRERDNRGFGGIFDGFLTGIGDKEKAKERDNRGFGGIFDGFLTEIGDKEKAREGIVWDSERSLGTIFNERLREKKYFYFFWEGYLHTGFFVL
jgi:hypothetical protein